MQFLWREPGAVLSEHLGLKHLYLAAQIHNMDLSLKQTGDLITLRAVLLVAQVRPRIEVYQDTTLQ